MKKFLAGLWRLLALAAIALGVWTYWQKNPNLQLAVRSRFNRQTQVQTDQNKSVKTTTRWSSPQATVYINLKQASLRQAAINAINNWNHTGCFTFTIVQSAKNAQITIRSDSNAATEAAGLTKTSYSPITGYLHHAKITLNSFYLLNYVYNYSAQRIQNTVEHELGHAIGLQHTNQVSVMYPKGSIYTIQPQDIANVKSLYNKKKNQN
ncbi:MAG: M57 family metalloprotease [Lactobacillus sp.]|jgi:predicted Zn-dependent protease|nr:M57 family metalloprotease [Lactobacillus sp.]MCH3990893.1 M57 family metalloprotease [Lactobacillus sp.]MCH4068391.1 M57 family metalloprotease [Lactobacillus sp.]MCI1304404.1 M57 family metalloprotease [Lactobacillus sp.]MCI1330390.1 M57 family metalloprotease [Lactobacillus sp.]